MTADAPLAADAALHVLIVEDDGLVAAELAADVLAAGHLVVGRAATTHGALELAEGEEVDVALIDVNLDGHGFGGDVAEVLLRRHGVRSIFVSGHLDASNREALLSLEPYAMLPKPHDVDDLTAALRGVAAARP